MDAPNCDGPVVSFPWPHHSNSPNISGLAITFWMPKLITPNHQIDADKYQVLANVPSFSKIGSFFSAKVAIYLRTSGYPSIIPNQCLGLPLEFPLHPRHSIPSPSAAGAILGRAAYQKRVQEEAIGDGSTHRGHSVFCVQESQPWKSAFCHLFGAKGPEPTMFFHELHFFPQKSLQLIHSSRDIN